MEKCSISVQAIDLSSVLGLEETEAVMVYEKPPTTEAGLWILTQPDHGSETVSVPFASGWTAPAIMANPDGFSEAIKSLIVTMGGVILRSKSAVISQDMHITSPTETTSVDLYVATFECDVSGMTALPIMGMGGEESQLGTHFRFSVPPFGFVTESGDGDGEIIYVDREIKVPVEVEVIREVEVEVEVIREVEVEVEVEVLKEVRDSSKDLQIGVASALAGFIAKSVL